MALASNVFVSFEAVREELRLNSQSADGILERRINALSRTFEEETGLIVKERTLTGFRVDGTGKVYIRIPMLPVQLVTKIDMRYDFDDSPYVDPITDTAAWMLKDLDEYGHSHTGFVQMLLSTAAKSWIFPHGKANILLDMKIGYAATHPVVSELTRLFIMQLAYEFKRWSGNEVGLLGRTLPDGGVTFASPQNLLKEVQDGLESMRIRRLS